MTQSDVHPDAVLESFLARSIRAQKRKNLLSMHEICRAQYDAGSRDFSLPTIGRLAEARGILKGRALYNAASSDYRALITAWSAYAGPMTVKPPKQLASNDFLMRIDDPAIRSIMQSVYVERDKLKAQLNLLKASTELTIDRRPLGAAISSGRDANSVPLVVMPVQLTPTEIDSLTMAVSKHFFEQEGWTEGTRGEVLTSGGRAVFGMGFTSAIRKVLRDTNGVQLTVTPTGTSLPSSKATSSKKKKG